MHFALHSAHFQKYLCFANNSRCVTFVVRPTGRQSVVLRRPLTTTLRDVIYRYCSLLSRGISSCHKYSSRESGRLTFDLLEVTAILHLISSSLCPTVPARVVRTFIDIATIGLQEQQRTQAQTDSRKHHSR